jgi:hypothetical protein
MGGGAGVTTRHHLGGAIHQPTGAGGQTRKRRSVEDAANAVLFERSADARFEAS